MATQTISSNEPEYPFKDKWHLIDLDVYDKIYQESKLRFSEVLGESQTITKRAITIFTLSLAFSAFFITKFKGLPVDYFIVLGTIGLFICALLIMSPRKIYYKGANPQSMITEDLISSEKCN